MSAGQIQIINNYATLENTAVYTTTSLTFVATGDNLILIPLTSTSVKISGVIKVSSDTATDGVSAEITYAQSSAIIASGTAVAGTVVNSSVVLHTQNVASNPNYIPIHAIITGLTIGLAYNFNLNVEAITAGTASFSIMQLTAEDY